MKKKVGDTGCINSCLGPKAPKWEEMEALHFTPYFESYLGSIQENGVCNFCRRMVEILKRCVPFKLYTAFIFHKVYNCRNCYYSIWLPSVYKIISTVKHNIII